MTFGGIQRPSERADLIAYLNSPSDSPAPAAESGGGARLPPSRSDRACC